MTEHDGCKHVKDTWEWHGMKFPYTAHIKLVPGPQKAIEVVDDVHVDLDPHALPVGLKNWFSKPCDDCVEKAHEAVKGGPTLPNIMAVAQVVECHHNYDAYCREIANHALDLYMLRGPSDD